MKNSSYISMFSMKNLTKSIGFLLVIITKSCLADSMIDSAYSRIAVLYLAGLEANECEQFPQVRKQIFQSISEEKLNPFISSIQSSLENYPQNSFFARLKRTQETQQSLDLGIKAILTGSDISTIHKQILMRSILNKQEPQSDSIIDQLKSVSPDSFWISERILQALQNETPSKVDNNEAQIIPKSEDLANQFTSIYKSNASFIMFYDESLLVSKQSYGIGSVKNLESFMEYEQLIQKAIELLDDSSLLIVIGSGAVEADLPQRQIFQLAGQMDELSSFFYAFTKGNGFNRDETVMNYREKMNQIMRAKSSLQYKLDTNVDSNVISEMSVASSLAGIIGIQIPSWNAGINILDIYPNTSNQIEFSLKILNDTFNTLNSQISMLNKLEFEFDLFYKHKTQDIYSQFDVLKAKMEIIKNNLIKHIKKQSNQKTNSPSILSEEEFSSYNKFLETTFELQGKLEQMLLNDQKKINTIIANVTLILSVLAIAISSFFLINVFKRTLKKIPRLSSGFIQNRRFVFIQFLVFLPFTIIGFTYFISVSFENMNVLIKCAQLFLLISILAYIIEILLVCPIAGISLKVVLTFILTVYILWQTDETSIGSIGIIAHLFLRLITSAWDSVSNNPNDENIAVQFRYICCSLKECFTSQKINSVGQLKTNRLPAEQQGNVCTKGDHITLNSEDFVGNGIQTTTVGEKDIPTEMSEKGDFQSQTNNGKNSQIQDCQIEGQLINKLPAASSFVFKTVCFLAKLLWKSAFSILILLYTVLRLVQFDPFQPAADSFMIAFIWVQPKRTINSKLTFTFIALSQYPFTIFFPSDISLFAYIIFGEAMMLILLVSELYKVISPRISFNKFFFLSVHTITFHCIMLRLKNPSNILEAALCGCLYCFSSLIYFALVSSSKGSSEYFSEQNKNKISIRHSIKLSENLSNIKNTKSDEAIRSLDTEQKQLHQEGKQNNIYPTQNSLQLQPLQAGLSQSKKRTFSKIKLLQDNKDTLNLPKISNLNNNGINRHVILQETEETEDVYQQNNANDNNKVSVIQQQQSENERYQGQQQQFVLEQRQIDLIHLNLYSNAVQIYSVTGIIQFIVGLIFFSLRTHSAFTLQQLQFYSSQSSEHQLIFFAVLQAAIILFLTALSSPKDKQKSHNSTLLPMQNNIQNTQNIVNNSNALAN